MTSLVRYTRPVSALTSLLDDFFNDNFYSLTDRDVTNSLWPRVDIVEDDNHYRLSADLPGMDKKDISVMVENGILTLKGEKKQERKEHKRDRYYHYERSYGSFCRSFNLPDTVDARNIKANYRNGTLELELRKTAESQPKAIEVKVD